MISDAFHYQEILSLDALRQYYFNAELHITKLNWLPGVFRVYFDVTAHIGDVWDLQGLQNGISMTHIIFAIIQRATIGHPMLLELRFEYTECVCVCVCVHVCVCTCVCACV